MMAEERNGGQASPFKNENCSKKSTCDDWKIQWKQAEDRRRRSKPDYTIRYKSTAQTRRRPNRNRLVIRVKRTSALVRIERNFKPKRDEPRKLSNCKRKRNRNFKYLVDDKTCLHQAKLAKLGNR